MYCTEDMLSFVRPYYHPQQGITQKRLIVSVSKDIQSA